MNFILNNKLKFEKNRYNKPVTPPKPVILTKTVKNPSLPLPIKVDIPIHSYSETHDNSIDFKLNNSTHLNIVKQIQTHNGPLPKVTYPLDQMKIYKNEISEISEINDIDFYNNDLIINIYGFSHEHLNTVLYEFLLELSKKIKIKIYIHTWNINKNVIEYYFQGLNVVSILIDQTNESLNETIFSSKMSVSDWKLMWTSMYRSMNEIYKKEDSNTIILNTRFDINYIFDINILSVLKKQKFTKNIFLKDSNDLSGVDNPIIGDKNTLYKLISMFYNNLDNVSMFYSSFTVPEASIYYENNRIFGVNYNDMFENIEKYSK